MKKIRVIAITIICTFLMATPVMAASGPGFSWREGKTPYWYKTSYHTGADKSEWKEQVKWHKIFVKEINKVNKELNAALKKYNTASQNLTKANATKNNAQKAVDTAQKTYTKKQKAAKDELDKLNKYKKAKKSKKQIEQQQKKYNKAKEAQTKAKKALTTAKTKYNNALTAYNKASKAKTSAKNKYKSKKDSKYYYEYELDTIERRVGELLLKGATGGTRKVVYICDGSVMGTKTIPSGKEFILLNIVGTKFRYVDREGKELSMQAAYDYYKTKGIGQYYYVYVKKASTPYKEVEIVGGSMQIRYILDGAEYKRETHAVGTKDEPSLYKWKDDKYLYTDIYGNILGEKVTTSPYGSIDIDTSKNYEEAAKYYQVGGYNYAGAVLEVYIQENPYHIY